MQMITMPFPAVKEDVAVLDPPLAPQRDLTYRETIATQNNRPIAAGGCPRAVG
jgi:hypothetical protein